MGDLKDRFYHFGGGLEMFQFERTRSDFNKGSNKCSRKVHNSDTYVK